MTKTSLKAVLLGLMSAEGESADGIVGGGLVS